MIPYKRQKKKKTKTLGARMDWRRPRLPPSLSSKTLLWRRCEARQRETLPSLERWKFGKGKWGKLGSGESWEVGRLGSGKVGLLVFI